MLTKDCRSGVTGTSSLLSELSELRKAPEDLPAFRISRNRCLSMCFTICGRSGTNCSAQKDTVEALNRSSGMQDKQATRNFPLQRFNASSLRRVQEIGAQFRKAIALSLWRKGSSIR